ncbi:hypothetical protein MTR67_017730 [Solanum verrucosum]|uniref:Uncharacterized protein n=1 Tax=Solanum verrucosum TaxID=315347 RepID=A0AAF0QNH2_SOLVR|nr:hypothetical protein MTR67_017730 [Solanum verrucosum]
MVSELWIIRNTIAYHDKATQIETEEEDTIEKILKVITTLCTKVDSMDNEIQKLKTDEFFDAELVVEEFLEVVVW